MTTSTVCILDKNGKHYNTLCSLEFNSSEVRNMKRHLELAVKHPDQYKFLDLETAVILVDGLPLEEKFIDTSKIKLTSIDMTDDEILQALGL